MSLPDPNAYAVTTTCGQRLNMLQVALLAHHVYVRFGRDMVDAAAAYGRMLESTVDTQDFSELVQLAQQEMVKFSRLAYNMSGKPTPEEYEREDQRPFGR